MKNQELHLLYVFDKVMTEGSISRAAEQLSMTQPAVSNAVSRMRHHWKDPLFVKNGRSIEPTAFALNLWKQVKAPMRDLSVAVDAGNFDPATSRRSFRIALDDHMVTMIWLKLRQLLEREAPHVDVCATPYVMNEAIPMMQEAKVDLAFGVFHGQGPEIRTTHLFDAVCTSAMRADHPLAGRPLTLDSFLAADHLLVSASGDNTSYLDTTLAAMGLKRRVAMTVNHFGAVVDLLAGSDLIAVAPQSVVSAPRTRSLLWLTPPPIALPSASVSLAWHHRHENDAGMIWLRERLIQITRDVHRKCALCVEQGPASALGRTKMALV